MLPTIGGVHRQRSTGRELTYWVAYSVVGDVIALVSIIQSASHMFDSPEGGVPLPAVTKPDKALHSLLRQYIDEADLGEGRECGRPTLQKRAGMRALM